MQGPQENEGAASFTLDVFKAKPVESNGSLVGLKWRLRFVALERGVPDKDGRFQARTYVARKASRACFRRIL